MQIGKDDGGYCATYPIKGLLNWIPQKSGQKFFASRNSHPRVNLKLHSTILFILSHAITTNVFPSRTAYSTHTNSWPL